ncbi:MAG: hypothetical protein ACR2G2_02270 [Pseudonocardia sp.]
MIDVVVLSQPDCHFCEFAEEVLARVGRDYPLAVRHISLASEQGQALATGHGVLFAPGILLDGQLLSYGRLSERRLRHHLRRQSTQATSPGGDRDSAADPAGRPGGADAAGAR